jgi:hypothetical protein
MLIINVMNVFRVSFSNSCSSLNANSFKREKDNDLILKKNFPAFYFYAIKQNLLVLKFPITLLYCFQFAQLVRLIEKHLTYLVDLCPLQ